MCYSYARPLCRKPRTAAWINLGITLLITTLLWGKSLLSHFWWLSGIFALSAFFFSLLAYWKPNTVLIITENYISQSGILFSKTMQFDDVYNAIIQRDPDAENYLRLVLTSKLGYKMEIDSRFIDESQDGPLQIIREILRSREIGIFEANPYD